MAILFEKGVWGALYQMCDLYLCIFATVTDLRPVILDSIDPRQESSESASSWSLSALDDAASQVHLLSLDFGNSPRSVRESSAAVAASSRARLAVSLTHESSIEQESSQLSQDSSNGSISQPEELNEEEPPISLMFDSSLRYRTGVDSPSASTPVGGPVSANIAMPLSLAGTGRALGTSVIVGGRTGGGGGLTVSESAGSGGGDSQGSSLSLGREDSAQQATSQGLCS